jgi:glycosyltransferase involved in cell wall biosynthesis
MFITTSRKPYFPKGVYENMKPTIAVVIPNYNDSNSLKQCLDSVFKQDDIPDQVLVVDDQSTDNSLDVIKEYLRDIPSAELVINANRLGTMGALNEGLKRVTADYALFLSSNDYLKPGIFAHARSCISVDGYPGVWSAMVSTIDEQGRQSYIYPSPVISLKDTYLMPDECIRLALLIGHWFTGTTLIYHCETLKKIGGFDLTYKGLADMLAALTVASIKGASFSPEPFGVMRLHAGGLMSRTSNDLAGLDVILDRMVDEGPKLSPQLFTQKFCDVMQRRIRFTAIRSINDNSWWVHARSWQGYRYKLLNVFILLLGKSRKCQLIMAFILLRPPQDIFTIIWYRMFGALFVNVRRRLS